MKQMRMLAPAIAAAAAIGLAGCSEYLDRRDTMTMWSGDAQQANLVSQAVHPSPRWARNRHLIMDGERMQRAHERYRTGQVIPPATSTGPVGLGR